MNSYKAVRNLAEAANSVTNKGLISEDWGPWPSIPPGLFRKDVFKPQPIHRENGGCGGNSSCLIQDQIQKNTKCPTINPTVLDIDCLVNNYSLDSSLASTHNRRRENP